MSKFVSTAVLALAALSFVPAAHAEEAAVSSTSAAATVKVGRMIYAANGQRLGRVYRVTSDGTVQVIHDSRMVNIPLSTLSEADGKTRTTLNKADLGR